jgi:glycosyltransferase involved in cell wall biosynthesis
MPMVSVILPTYNRGLEIKRAIDSVLKQSYRDFELIVVDDGSTDATDLLLEEYIAHGFIRYHRQDNRGVAEARNLGVDVSNGRYIAFCDADDVWLPKKLERQMPLFDHDTVLVFSNAYIADAALNTKFIAYDVVHPCAGFAYERLLQNNFLVTSSVIVRKASLTERFRGVTASDWRMWLQVAKKGRFAYTEEPLVIYAEREGGLSKSKRKLFDARITIRCEELAWLKKNASRCLLTNIFVLTAKDRLLLTLYTLLPGRVTNRIERIYYNCLPFRRVTQRIIRH